jgi:hypothetical protein
MCHRLLCVDTDRIGAQSFFALERFIIVPNTWDEVVTVRGKDGDLQSTGNRRQPPLDKNGKIVRFSLELRDLSFNMLARLTNDETFKLDFLFLATSPDEKFAYAPCAKFFESGPPGVSDFYGVCRYRLDGKQNSWERLFVLENHKEIRHSIGNIDVSVFGDVYFNLPGARDPYNGIWKFEAKSGAITQIARGKPYRSAEYPKVSPDGRQVMFVRQDPTQKLFIAKERGRD